MSSPSLKKRKLELELAAAVTPIVLLAFVSEDGIPSCYAVPVASLFRPLDEIKAQLKLAPNSWDCYIPSTCEITDDVLNKETASLEDMISKCKGATKYANKTGFEPAADQVIVFAQAVCDWN